jgi:hypothetical protein
VARRQAFTVAMRQIWLTEDITLCKRQEPGGLHVEKAKRQDCMMSSRRPIIINMRQALETARRPIIMARRQALQTARKPGR